MPIFTLVASFIALGIMHLLAKLFGGKAGFKEYYRTMGVGYVGMWISVIPILGPMITGLIGLWYIVVNYSVLKAVHKLSTLKAVIVIGIPVIIGLVAGVVLAATFAAMFAGLLGSGLPALG